MKLPRPRTIAPYLLLVWIACVQAQGVRLISPAVTSNSLLLRWTNSVAGQAYTLQSRDRLSNSIWLTLESPQPWPTTQTQWTETLSTNTSPRFYRVAAVTPSVRGKILSSNLLQTYSANSLSLLFATYGIPVTAQYAVKHYRVVYETLDPLGGKTQASGGMFLPQNVGKALPLFSYQHGTTTFTNDVASRLESGDFVVGLVFASVGYAAALPDYLGLGDSPGFHPYVHARSEATAGVDLLRAVRRYCASNSISLNSQLFLAGYSQGGHATLALHRELEKYHTNEFTVTASAPMAGPYDMSGTELNDFLSPRCPPNPYYYAYILNSYQQVYSLAPDWASLLQPPYDTDVPPLFNGNTDGGIISSFMPQCNMSDVLQPAQRAALQNTPNSPLRQALRDNDLIRWKPTAPLRLYHCAGDADVLVANSQVALSNFLAQGATQVQWIDPQPSADHSDCFFPSMLGAKAWFDSLKQ